MALAGNGTARWLILTNAAPGKSRKPFLVAISAGSTAAGYAGPGEELLTFYRFPKSQWKCLRTTNPIERINGEFRRRTKTQGAFTNESSALTLLYGLFALGQINLRRIHGWRDMPLVAKMNWKEVA